MSQYGIALPASYGYCAVSFGGKTVYHYPQPCIRTGEFVPVRNGVTDTDRQKIVAEVRCRPPLPRSVEPDMRSLLSLLQVMSAFSDFKRGPASKPLALFTDVREAKASGATPQMAALGMADSAPYTIARLCSSLRVYQPPCACCVRDAGRLRRRRRMRQHRALPQHRRPRPASR
jgi:hypothetical protein